MTTTTQDPNRAHWEAAARGEPVDWGALATPPDAVDEDAVDDPRGLWLRPHDAVPGVALLAVHGGGFVSGSAHTHRRTFGHLARAAGVAAFVVDYGLVRADATLELVPDGAWFDGKVACAAVLAGAVGAPGDWAMAPTVANGAPAVVVRLRGEPLGVAVLDVRRDGIAGITVFADAALVERFPAAG